MALETFDTVIADRLRALESMPDSDAEIWHAMADDILCELLIDCGYPKTVAAFNALQKWYA